MIGGGGTHEGVSERDARSRDVDPEEGRLRPVSRRQEAIQPPPIDREITIAEGLSGQSEAVIPIEILVNS